MPLTNVKYQKMKTMIYILSFITAFTGTAQNLADCYENVKSSVFVVEILSVSPKNQGSARLGRTGHETDTDPRNLSEYQFQFLG